MGDPTGLIAISALVDVLENVYFSSTNYMFTLLDLLILAYSQLSQILDDQKQSFPIKDRMTSRTLVRGTETVTEKHSCDIMDPNNNERLTSHRTANGQRRARKQRSHKRSLDTTKSV